MRRNDVKPGMLVVLNDRPDAQVYTVESIKGYTVPICYLVNGRWTVAHRDCDMLKVPTPEQLKNGGL